MRNHQKTTKITPLANRAIKTLHPVPQSVAEAVKLKVEKLLAAKITGHALDAETARWAASLDKVLADNLAAVGLIPKAKPPG